MNDTHPAAAAPIQPPESSPRAKRSPALSNMVRELRRAPGAPGPDASGLDSQPGSNPIARSEPDTDRFDLSRLAARHGVPAHAIGAWARRARGARLLDQIAEYEHQRSRLLLGACVSRAVQLLLSLAGGEGGNEESLSGETRRKACVDLLKLGHELSMIPRPNNESSSGALAVSTRSPGASRSRDAEQRSAADQETDAAFQERARRLLEELGSEPSLNLADPDTPAPPEPLAEPPAAPDSPRVSIPPFETQTTDPTEAQSFHARVPASAAD